MAIEQIRAEDDVARVRESLRHADYSRTDAACVEVEKDGGPAFAALANNDVLCASAVACGDHDLLIRHWLASGGSG